MAGACRNFFVMEKRPDYRWMEVETLCPLLIEVRIRKLSFVLFLCYIVFPILVEHAIFQLITFSH